MPGKDGSNLRDDDTQGSSMPTSDHRDNDRADVERVTARSPNFIRG
jgi:hypothetical protein